MTRLTIPPRTPLLSIERLPDSSWAVWIYTSPLGLRKPHNERDGTYLLLASDGSVSRITVSGEEPDDILLVMEAK